MSTTLNRRPLACALLMIIAQSAAADYRTDVGFDRLGATAGPLPSGAGLTVVQVEALSNNAYFPDTARAGLAHVTFTDGTGGQAAGISGHATSMALRLAGNTTTSLTPGLDRITVFEAGDWLSRILAVGSGTAPGSPAGNVFNHSWVASYTTSAANAEALARLDWLVSSSDRPHIVGLIAGQPLQNQAFNVLAVNSTGAAKALVSQPINATYVAGRPLTHLVVPITNTSNATAVVSSATTLLAAERAQRGLAAHPALLVKAILMAGAARQATNSDGSEIVDFGTGTDGLTDNGLDPRFGAGQLDIAASYAISAADAQPSTQDGGTGISGSGHHLDESFGGAAGSNSVAYYPFEVQGSATFGATLVWEAAVRDITTGPGFTPSTSLENLDLALVALSTTGEPVVIARSASNIDNTESIFREFEALGPGSYRLEVSVRAGQSAQAQRYALAWKLDDRVTTTAAVPVFGAAWFTWLALAGVCATALRRGRDYSGRVARRR